jgi:sRNA-binding regulator protein Hfq
MSKTQNLQDNFLNALRKEHTPVSIFFWLTALNCKVGLIPLINMW